MIAVLAGNAREFSEYVRWRKLTTKQAMFCAFRDHMKGIRFTEFVRVGTWYLQDEDLLDEFELQEHIALSEGRHV